MDSECCVCYAPTTDSLPCAHLLCGDCYEMWTGRGKRTCPLCRSAILNDEEEEQSKGEDSTPIRRFMTLQRFMIDLPEVEPLLPFNQWLALDVARRENPMIHPIRYLRRVNAKAPLAISYYFTPYGLKVVSPPRNGAWRLIPHRRRLHHGDLITHVDGVSVVGNNLDVVDRLRASEGYVVCHVLKIHVL